MIPILRPSTLWPPGIRPNGLFDSVLAAVMLSGAALAAHIAWGVYIYLLVLPETLHPLSQILAGLNGLIFYGGTLSFILVLPFAGLVFLLWWQFGTPFRRLNLIRVCIFGIVTGFIFSLTQAWALSALLHTHPHHESAAGESWWHVPGIGDAFFAAALINLGAFIVISALFTVWRPQYYRVRTGEAQGISRSDNWETGDWH